VCDVTIAELRAVAYRLSSKNKTPFTKHICTFFIQHIYVFIRFAQQTPLFTYTELLFGNSNVNWPFFSRLYRASCYYQSFYYQLMRKRIVFKGVLKLTLKLK